MADPFVHGRAATVFGASCIHGQKYQPLGPRASRFSFSSHGVRRQCQGCNSFGSGCGWCRASRGWGGTKDPSYEEVKQQLEEVKRSKEAFSKMPGMESVVSQLAFKVLQMESALEDLKPKIPPSVQARKLLEKITKKQQRLAELKAQCSAAFQQLKDVRAAYAEARQGLIVLPDQWTQVDVNLGDPPSEISYGPDGPQDTQMDSGSEGDTEGAASLKRPRPGKGFKSWITSHGSGKAQSVLSDSRSSCGPGASDYSRT